MAILRNGNPVDYKMLCNDVEIERTTYKGEEIWAGLHGKYVVQDGVVNTEFASGEAYTYSTCLGNTTGTSSKVELILIDKLLNMPMTLTFRGYTTQSVFNGDRERYAYVECDGVRVATVDLLTTQSANKDETITVDFIPTSSVIYIGTYVRRDINTTQNTQSNTQHAIITNLQII